MHFVQLSDDLTDRLYTPSDYELSATVSLASSTVYARELLTYHPWVRRVNFMYVGYFTVASIVTGTTR